MSIFHILYYCFVLQHWGTCCASCILDFSQKQIRRAVIGSRVAFFIFCKSSKDCTCTMSCVNGRNATIIVPMILRKFLETMWIVVLAAAVESVNKCMGSHQLERVRWVCICSNYAERQAAPGIARRFHLGFNCGTIFCII